MYSTFPPQQIPVLITPLSLNGLETLTQRNSREALLIELVKIRLYRGDYMSFVSQNIEAIRLQRNLSQKDMADKLNVTEQTVSDWESGESEPDIETLVKIADLLNTEISTLIHGLPDPELQKKEKLHLVYAIGFLLILSIAFYFLRPIANKLRIEYIINEPTTLIQLCLLPLISLVFGWATMQALGIMDVARPSNTKFAKAIHVITLIVVLLYTALMLPFLIENTRYMIKALQYFQNPALHPNGISFVYNIPLFLQKIELQLMSVTYSKPIIFIIPSVIFWLTKPIKKST